MIKRPRSKAKAVYIAKVRANIAKAKQFKLDHAKLVAFGMSPMAAHNKLSEQRGAISEALAQRATL